MKQLNKITIIGLGLIGASLGIALKKAKASKKIFGVSRKDSTINTALKRKAVNVATKDIENALKDSDLIVIATPVETIKNLAPVVKEFAKSKAIITDVGSTKEEIVDVYESQGLNFVGSHPLAGSEKKGPKFADPQLFAQSLCIITPTNKTKLNSLTEVQALWKAVGAKTHILSPFQHDLIVSTVSHLPHLIAFSLMDTVPDKYLKYAPSSLKDVTRIAASDAEIWLDIFLTNRKALLNNITKYKKNIEALEHLIKIHDRSRLFQALKKSSSRRLKI